LCWKSGQPPARHWWLVKKEIWITDDHPISISRRKKIDRESIETRWHNSTVHTTVVAWGGGRSSERRLARRGRLIDETANRIFHRLLQTPPSLRTLVSEYSSPTSLCVYTLTSTRVLGLYTKLFLVSQTAALVQFRPITVLKLQ